MRIPWTIVCLLAVSFAFAQEGPPAAPVYRLNFAFHEMENGKRLSTHNYSLLLEPGAFSRLNIGSKVPVPSGSPGNMQYTYVDVGVNLRCRVIERGTQLILTGDAEVSNLGADRENAGRPAPQIRQIRAEMDAAISLSQPTPVATMDDPAGSKHYEIEVTATRAK